MKTHSNVNPTLTLEGGRGVETREFWSMSIGGAMHPLHRSRSGQKNAQDGPLPSRVDRKEGLVQLNFEGSIFIVL